MTVRYAESSEKPLVKQLWEACFPGEDAFTDYFFDSLYDPSRALLCVGENGDPAAMLHMMPYTMAWLGHETPVTYVYGVGTHPDFRRRGLSARLMDQALFEMHLRGVLFSALVPQEDWLFDFYRPFGYAPVCMLTPRAYTFIEEPRRAGADDTTRLNTLYETAQAGRTHILRRPEHWHALLRENALAGGQVLLDGGAGYAVYPRGDRAPSECFGPGARDAGPGGFFGCLRVVDAERAVNLACREGFPMPEGLLDDPYAPWNAGALTSRGDSDPQNVLDAAELAEFFFSENPPYMNLMHN